MTVTVIGGGIAGASAAYFLSRAGVEVTVIDAGAHAASHVPAALINPVRGQSGQVGAQALAGMHFTWELLADLARQGHPVPGAQVGVLRPVPDERTRLKFVRHLPGELRHEWLGAPPAPLRPGWAQTLWLPEGGWVDGAAFCGALLAASGAQVRRARAVRWEAGEVELEGGQKVSSRAVVFCGGSVGSTWAGESATHRMGSVLKLDRAVAERPLSFGAYLSPAQSGGVLGGTFEAPAPRWAAPELPLRSLDWLLNKGEALAELSGTRVTGRWTGSRLSGLQAGRDSGGVWRLSGLSSKGFLLGPLLASHLAGQIAGALSVT